MILDPDACVYDACMYDENIYNGYIYDAANVLTGSLYPGPPTPHHELPASQNLKQATGKTP